MRHLTRIRLGRLVLAIVFAALAVAVVAGAPSAAPRNDPPPKDHHHSRGGSGGSSGSSDSSSSEPATPETPDEPEPLIPDASAPKSVVSPERKAQALTNVHQIVRVVAYMCASAVDSLGEVKALA